MQFFAKRIRSILGSFIPIQYLNVLPTVVKNWGATHPITKKLNFDKLKNFHFILKQ